MNQKKQKRLNKHVKYSKKLTVVAKSSEFVISQSQEHFRLDEWNIGTYNVYCFIYYNYNSVIP